MRPKEFAWKIREWQSTIRREELLLGHNTKGNSTETPHFE